MEFRNSPPNSLLKREVDFLVTINDRPWFAVETKLSDTVFIVKLPLFPGQVINSLYLSGGEKR
jgi:hypothetical protein